MSGVTVGNLAAVSGPFCFPCFRPTRAGGAAGSNFFSFLLLPCEGGVCGGEREYVGPLEVWVRRKKLVRGILVFSSGPVANMNHFYCSLANMRPFIVYRPN